MRKLLTAILLIIASATYAQKSFYYGVYLPALVTMPSIVFMDQGWHGKPAPDGLYVTGSIDPGMIVYNGAIDTRTGLYYGLGRVEVSATYENVPEPFYYNSISIAGGYRLFNRQSSITIAPEVSHIWNRNGETLYKTFSTGGNIIWRYSLSEVTNLAFTLNAKTRSEISKFGVVSFYAGMEVLLTK